MLLNLSNHPSSQWSADQWTEACDRYGSVHDIAHPHIDPEGSEYEITCLADEYFRRIKQIDPQAVHIMGEHTFCFPLILRLQQAGYSCVASTTERIVEELDDGRRTYRFRFVRFRCYSEYSQILDL